MEEVVEQKDIFSLAQVKELPESRVVVIVDGGVYDVTEFIDLHPGGREILLKFNRRDASRAFEATKHSLTAIRMLPNYCIGILEGCEEQYQQSVEALSSESGSLVNTLRDKLVTHEDKFHLHKILGSLALGHLAFRTLLLIFGIALYIFVGDNILLQINYQLDPAWLLLGFAAIHGLLSLSSLQFAVPRKSNQSKPMIHQLFRAHSICFALRAVLCMILFIVLQDDVVMLRLALSVVILVTFVAADIVTVTHTDEGDSFNTTASMPYWFGISLERQKAHKFLYGYGQFLASYVCLLGGYLGAAYTLAPIQGAAFGMTLVRKNIISARAYHNAYLVSLFLPVPFALIYFPSGVSIGLVVVLILFCLRLLGVNKYLLWIPPLLLFNWLLVPEAHRTLFVNVTAISYALAIMLNLAYLKLVNPKRIDKNNRILSSKMITDDSFELIIRSRLAIDIAPGQHVLIRLDDQLERKYTPIWSKALEETEQTLLCLRIKKYDIEGKRTASSFLASRPTGTVLDLHGPVGEKYYQQSTNTIIDGSRNIALDVDKHNVVLFSAGSGITPLFQLGKLICSQGLPVDLVSCDKSPAHMMMSSELNELKHDFPKLLQWTTVFSSPAGMDFDKSDTVINARLDAEILRSLLTNKDGKQDLIIICGPNEWQNMIKAALKDRGEEQVQVIVW